MAPMFTPYSRDQGYLFPPSPRDWLPDDHLVYFIMEMVDHLDLSKIESKYRFDGSGPVPFHPRLMVSILIYSYCTGIFSSRKIAAALVENVALRVIAGDQRPGHRTVARFRRNHSDEFGELFVQVVRMAAETGIVKLGTVAVDGSKISANASSKKSRTYKQLKEEEKQIVSEIASRLAAAEAQDAAEDELYGPDVRGDELPPELTDRKQRLRLIREAKQRLEERQRKADADLIEADKRRKAAGKRKPGIPRTTPLGVPPDKTQQNLTDFDCCVMKFPTGAFDAAYNAQTAVADGSRIIVSQSVSKSASDMPSLIPMVKAVEENLGKKPTILLADAGYKSEKGLAWLENQGIDSYVAVQKKGTAPRTPMSKNHSILRMKEKIETERGQKLYKLRQQIVEPVFAWIKRCLGFTHFRMRSLRNVQGEWSLVCLSLNLKRMANMKAK